MCCSGCNLIISNCNTSNDPVGDMPTGIYVLHDVTGMHTEDAFHHLCVGIDEFCAVQRVTPREPKEDIKLLMQHTFSGKPCVLFADFGLVPTLNPGAIVHVLELS